MAVKAPLAPLGGCADLDRPCALPETSGMAGAGKEVGGEEDVDPIAGLDVEVLVWARRRAENDLRHGYLPRVRRPPARKEGFPKLLLLDTWAWGKFARLMAGLEGAATELRPALNAILQAQRRGRIVTPVATTNALEVLNGHADMAKRRPLAETIVTLSRNHFWVQPSGDRQIELAVRRHFLEENPPGLRQELLALGGRAVLGTPTPLDAGSPRENEILRRVFCDPIVNVEMLLKGGAPGTPKRTYRFEHLVDPAKDLEESFLSETLGALLRNPKIYSFLEMRGAEGKDFDRWIGERKNLERVCVDLPSSYVQHCLLFQAHRNHGPPPWEPPESDVDDIEFLTQTLPFANIVVTEKKWGGVAVTSRLDSRFDTTILRGSTGLQTLPAELQRLHCL